MTDEVSIRFLVDNPLPPGGTAQFEEWASACRSLGPTAAEAFLVVLTLGSGDEQYRALVGLRVLGYEAWAVGTGRKTMYAVRAPGAITAQTVVPKVTRREAQ